MPTKRKKLVIFDGNALVHRAYHSIPPLNAPDGTMVNAVFGVATVTLKILKELKPDYVAYSFDLKGPTFRHKQYKEYKAQREEADQELYDQIPITRDMVQALGIPVYEKEGFEADDVIGTIVTNAKETDNVIVTGDFDQFQLISTHTKVYRLKRGLTDVALYDARAVKQRYGFAPEQVIDYKALRGDPSDNIKGVPGVGEKTATKLIQDYGTIEKLYTELKKKGELDGITPRIANLLLEHENDARESRELVTIVTNVKTGFKLPDAELAIGNDALTFFRQYGFLSLMNKLRDFGAEDRVPESEPERTTSTSSSLPKREKLEYTLVDDDATLATMITELKKAKILAVDTETTSTDARTAKLLGVSISGKKGKAYYVNVADNPARLKKLSKLLEDTTPKVGHNLKYDYTVLKQHGVTLGPLHTDTMIAAYLFNPGTRGYSLDALVLSEFGHEMQPIESLIGKKGKDQIGMDQVPLDKLSWYAAEDADFSLRLAEVFTKEIKKRKLDNVLYTIEMPLIPVLSDMEVAGISVDTVFLKTMEKKLSSRLSRVEKLIHEHAGGAFNIQSPAQLKEILFEKLKIDSTGLSKTQKTGSISTAAGELEKLQGAHPIIDLILEFRELAKLLSTYIRALPELVDRKTKRVHTTYSQSVAATGRLASNDPNLQNIPIRTELGREIRKAFVAEWGNRILSADYSQIELRIVASLAKVQAMIEAFTSGQDIHQRTAADINGIGLEEVTKEQRRAAKEVNFGVLYGMGAPGLSKRTGISFAEAKDFINRYFETFPEIREYVDRTKQEAHANGYVETLFGRRRYLKDIQSRSQMLRARAEREAINMPIQGTAADLIKLAMIEVAKGLPRVSSESRLLLQVHDELIVETPSADVAKVEAYLKKAMSSVHTLDVPIEVEVSHGRNWDEAH